jgi:DNA polymerase III alpha subunit
MALFHVRPYAELQVATPFSFLAGASHANELLGQAKALGIAAVGIADRNTVAGVVRAHQAAKGEGMRRGWRSRMGRRMCCAIPPIGRHGGG